MRCALVPAHAGEGLDGGVEALLGLLAFEEGGELFLMWEGRSMQRTRGDEG